MNRNYRSSMWFIFIQLAVVYWGLTFARRIYILLADEQWLPIYNSTLIGGTAVLLALSLAVALYYRVEITNGNIKGPNLWGGFTNISLGENFNFKVTGIPGFRYLKINGSTKGSIWVILPVNNQSDLFSQLSEYSEKSTYSSKGG